LGGYRGFSLGAIQNFVLKYPLVLISFKLN